MTNPRPAAGSPQLRDGIPKGRRLEVQASDQVQNDPGTLHARENTANHPAFPRAITRGKRIGLVIGELEKKERTIDSRPRSRCRIIKFRALPSPEFVETRSHLSHGFKKCRACRMKRPRIAFGNGFFWVLLALYISERALHFRTRQSWPCVVYVGYYLLADSCWT